MTHTATCAPSPTTRVRGMCTKSVPLAEVRAKLGIADSETRLLVSDPGVRYRLIAAPS